MRLTGDLNGLPIDQHLLCAYYYICVDGPLNRLALEVKQTHSHILLLACHLPTSYIAICDLVRVSSIQREGRKMQDQENCLCVTPLYRGREALQGLR